MPIWVWYRNFMKDEQGTWITEDLDENPGIRRLDWVIQTAEKYDMYISDSTSAMNTVYKASPSGDALRYRQSNIVTPSVQR
ncbi:MAG: hypothetical protein K2P40_13670 [Lachnospiraceae bacterium]|nr:hypothetical protein [Lachnospiraceae bacterium]